MRLLAIILTLMLAAPAWADGIQVIDPYARTARPGAPTGAVYMVLENKGDTADRLLAAESPVAQIVQIHRHIEEDGVMRMRQLANGIPLAPGDRHELARGGDHVMLMGLTGTLSDGDTIPLTLIFEKAGEITFDVPLDSARGQGAKP